MSKNKVSKKDLSQSNPYETSAKHDFLKDAMEYRDNFEDEEEFQEALALWPVCPDCGRRRITTCPICHASGNLFPLADIDYWDPETEIKPSEAKSDAQKSCCCQDLDHQQNGDHQCSCQKDANSPCSEQVDNSKPSDLSTNEKDSSDQEVNPNKYVFSTQLGNDPLGIRPFEVSSDFSANDFEDSGEKVITKQTELKLVVCHVCSEPFVPNFPPRCEWCGHIFESGKNIYKKIKQNEDPAADETFTEDLDATVTLDLDEFLHRKVLENKQEEINPKLLFVIGLLVVLGCAAAFYFYNLFR